MRARMLVNEHQLQSRVLRSRSPAHLEHRSPQAAVPLNSVPQLQPRRSPDLRYANSPRGNFGTANNVSDLPTDTTTTKFTSGALARPHSTTVKVANIPHRALRKSTQK